jgi:hypothetical protein
MEVIRSLDERYQYKFTHSWETGGTAAWIMLNPSRGEPETNPTLRRVITFTRQLGLSRLVIVNLYAYRADKPGMWLSQVDDPGNNDYITEAVAAADAVVAAWGAHPVARTRADEVMSMLGDVPLLCLGLTKHDQPKHPLYVSAGTQLAPYASPENSGKLFTSQQG